MAVFDAITKGKTGYFLELLLRDAATGQGRPGLAAAAVQATYFRGGAAAGAAVATAAAVPGVHSGAGGGGWAEVDATARPGLYQFSVPDAALAPGADAVTLQFRAAGVLDRAVRLLLVDADLRDGVRLGLAALPAAPAASAGGLPTADGGNAVRVQSGTGPGQISVAAGVVAANVVQSGGSPVSPAASTAIDLAQALPADPAPGTVGEALRFAASRLDAAVTSRQPSGAVTVAGYAAGADPAAMVLANPVNRLATDASGRVTAGSVADKQGYRLAADGVDAVAVEAGANLRQAMSAVFAASAGTLSGADGGPITIRGGGVAATRITATTDAVGNRSAVVLNLPA